MSATKTLIQQRDKPHIKDSFNQLQEEYKHHIEQLQKRSYYVSSGRRCVRGPTARTARGRSWRPATQQKPPRHCWLSAQSWLDSLTRALATEEASQVRARRGWVKVETILDVAAVDARTAQGRTGRGVATSNRHVAQQLGCSEKTVQRARGVICDLGFSVIVETGRRLTAEERHQAWKYHGRRQVNIASERALITPPPEHEPAGSTQALVPLSRRDQVSKKPRVCRQLPKRADARRGKTKHHHNSRSRPSLEIQKLAAQLAVLCPGLARGHIGALCAVLERLGIDPAHWSAYDICSEITALNQERNLAEPRNINNPLGLFTHQLQLVLARNQYTPAQRRAAIAAQRAAQRAALAQEIHQRQQQEEQLRTPERQEKIRAIIAAGRARLREVTRKAAQEHLRQELASQEHWLENYAHAQSRAGEINDLLAAAARWEQQVLQHRDRRLKHHDTALENPIDPKRANPDSEAD